MGEGLILSLHFTAFDIEDGDEDSDCYDHLTITDGTITIRNETIRNETIRTIIDGPTLMEKSCGNSLPANITSTTNIVKLVFKTDYSGTRPGWSVSWSAVTPGECQQHVW